MKLEAKDRKNPGLTCVASIIDKDDKNQLLIHFDGWSETYDYWCKPDTADIHPPMWCSKNGRQLQPPHSELLVCTCTVWLHTCIIIVTTDSFYVG